MDDVTSSPGPSSRDANTSSLSLGGVLLARAWTRLGTAAGGVWIGSAGFKTSLQPRRRHLLARGRTMVYFGLDLVCRRREVRRERGEEQRDCESSVGGHVLCSSMTLGRRLLTPRVFSWLIPIDKVQPRHNVDQWCAELLLSEAAECSLSK